MFSTRPSPEMPNKQLRSAQSSLTGTIRYLRRCVSNHFRTMCVLINILIIIHTFEKKLMVVLKSRFETWLQFRAANTPSRQLQHEQDYSSDGAWVPPHYSFMFRDWECPSLHPVLPTATSIPPPLMAPTLSLTLQTVFQLQRQLII